MIELKDLRLGNLVLMGGKVVTMDLRLFHAVMNAFTGYEPEPVVLTIEWFKRMGFRRVNYSFYLDRFVIEAGISKFFNNGYSFRIIIDNENSAHAASVKYVHEVQNLFYALNGKELTIE